MIVNFLAEDLSPLIPSVLFIRITSLTIYVTGDTGKFTVIHLITYNTLSGPVVPNATPDILEYIKYTI